MEVFLVGLVNLLDQLGFGSALFNVFFGGHWLFELGLRLLRMYRFWMYLLQFLHFLNLLFKFPESFLDWISLEDRPLHLLVRLINFIIDLLILLCYLPLSCHLQPFSTQDRLISGM